MLRSWIVVAFGVLQLVGRGIQAAEPQDWPRLYLHDPALRAVFSRSLDRVTLRLPDPRCQAIFDLYKDGSGHPLSRRLAEFGATPGEYLRLLVFVDGGHHRRCGSDIAYTHPGSRVVYVCPLPFYRSLRDHPEHAEAAIIHEALHTLGLPDDRPSSAEITQSVRRACGSHILLPRR